ncbi:MAG TPA: bifunctional response regulator/alkaline phosphatase family protein [Bacteroidales bacterium]|nr:bifunctional response regulator/alkaline phosphatase family protein [Bacteroidales bacterium]
MTKVKILWVDDEIDLLKPHILFLQEKGYAVHTSNNGDEALDQIRDGDFDIIFLDENMPGLTGLETLAQIRNDYPNLPVVMITRNEQEHTMEDAIGSNISDYLIKPVNPNQILLCLKKNLENKRLISEKTTQAYQQQFRHIGMEISNRLSHSEWVEVYKKMVFWELELEKSNDESMNEVLALQKSEANTMFSKFYENNYIAWLSGKVADTPVMSHNLFKEKVFPALNQPENLFVIVIDNLRYDQWKVIQPVLEEFFRVQNDEMYYSILPSATQYARNALFAGLLPTEIERKYPKYWIYEEDEGTKNQYENELLGELLRRYGKDIRYNYSKILNINAGKKYVENLPNLMNNKLNILVYNFVDMLSHARTDMEIIRELASDEAAYRSITLSWLKHSPLLDVIKYLSEQNVNLLITSDHGSVKVGNPVKIVGDKNTNTNLRYKYGKALNYEKKQVFEVKNPQDIFLPRINVSTAYVFCRENDFFAYPNNYHYFVNYYSNTFQHGGISMEEILIPVIFLNHK